LIRGPNRATIISALCWILPLLLYWLVLALRLPYPISRQLSNYSSLLFMAALAAFYLAFRPRPRVSLLAALALTMLLAGLSVSSLWTSGQSDTGIIGGLLPYKDSKNYYFGALQILNGLPLQAGVNAVRRPMFPGLLSTALLLTGGDLKIATAILAQLAAFGLFLTARTMRHSLGPAAAAMMAALLFFHIEPKLGYNLSELAGFTLGCLAFCMLWEAAANRSWMLAALGLITLVAAVTARAGAFVVFPALTLWCGWLFRGQRRFSLKAAALVAAGIAAVYLLVHPLYSRLLRVDLTDQWDNFVHAMYGQVHGGTGWHKAIEDLGTTDTTVALHATWEYFRAHPSMLLVGVGKSYRDFFLPSEVMIFPVGSPRESAWVNYTLWAALMVLLLRGLLMAIRGRRLGRLSMLLAAFAGILLSVPFLPPMDGGARFYASTMAFFFALPAIAVAGRQAFIDTELEGDSPSRSSPSLAASSAVALLACILVVPVLISRLTLPLAPAAPSCPAGQQPFVIRALPQSHIDLVPGTAKDACGQVPLVCLADFDLNATQKINDDLMQAVLALAHTSPGGIRITPAMNLLDARFGYFIETMPAADTLPAGQLESGCAALIETRNSRLYEITR
jgi:hypothetical protein